MDLNSSGQAMICSAVTLLALGILTGGIVFYVFIAAVAAAVAIDYFRCRALTLDLVRHLTISRHVSRDNLELGSRLDLVYELNYTGSRSFFLRCLQPQDQKESAPGQAKDVFLETGVQTVRFSVTPAKYGKYLVPGLRMVSQSYLFQGTVTGGGVHPVNVYLTPVRAGPMGRGRGSPCSSAIGSLEVTSRSGGCDFAGIRNYLPGDNIRYIDWARTSKSHTPVVRDFEETSVMPLFLLIDTDASMQTGEPWTELDSAAKFAMSISREIMAAYERVGLACFSLKSLTCFLPPGSGRAHQVQLMSLLMSLETTGGTQARPLAMPTLHEAALAGKALAASPDLQPLLAVMGEAVDRFAENLCEDGFVKAVNKASQTGIQCHMVILTNLSMGVASLVNGIRLARYSGHLATVILTPHLWYRPHDQAAPGVLYDQYRRVQEVVSLLRAMKVNVIEVCPADQPESIATGYRLRGPIPRM